MSKDYLLKSVLNEVLLNEIGETNIKPLNFTKSSEFEDIEYKFEIPINKKEEIVTVVFQSFNNISNKEKEIYLQADLQSSRNCYNAGFEIGGNEVQLEKSDMKTLLIILSTVSSIIKSFIHDKKPDAVFIMGNYKQKSRIYSAYVLKQIESISGYQAMRHRTGWLIRKPFIHPKRK